MEPADRVEWYRSAAVGPSTLEDAAERARSRPDEWLSLKRGTAGRGCCSNANISLPPVASGGTPFTRRVSAARCRPIRSMTVGGREPRGVRSPAPGVRSTSVNKSEEWRRAAQRLIRTSSQRVGKAPAALRPETSEALSLTIAQPAPQPPSPCAGRALAATGPTIRSKSACPPGLP